MQHDQTYLCLTYLLTYSSSATDMITWRCFWVAFTFGRPTGQWQAANSSWAFSYLIGSPKLNRHLPRDATVRTALSMKRQLSSNSQNTITAMKHRTNRNKETSINEESSWSHAWHGLCQFLHILPPASSNSKWPTRKVADCFSFMA